MLVVASLLEVVLDTASTGFETDVAAAFEVVLVLAVAVAVLVVVLVVAGQSALVLVAVLHGAIRKIGRGPLAQEGNIGLCSGRSD